MDGCLYGLLRAPAAKVQRDVRSGAVLARGRAPDAEVHAEAFQDLYGCDLVNAKLPDVEVHDSVHATLVRLAFATSA